MCSDEPICGKRCISKLGEDEGKYPSTRSGCVRWVGSARFHHKKTVSPPMFEITAADIAALNDEDLRSLVARLCEAEMRQQGLPTSAVSWGGDQNAPDGGVDVRVDLSKKKRWKDLCRAHPLVFKSKSLTWRVRRYLKRCAPAEQSAPSFGT
jgi:hypothetical protein